MQWEKAERNQSQSDKETNGISLDYTLFLQREYQITHLSYEREFAFYDAVQSGNIREVKSRMLPLDSNQLGKLSPHPVRNLKYHLIITIALITRFCIEGGMPPEDAYTLSDLYIQKIDVCTAEDEIHALHARAVLDFTEKMHAIHRGKNLSQPMIRAMDYIYDHLQEKLSLAQLAQVAGYHKTYFCARFKQETGVTPGQYITSRKIEAAKGMLRDTAYSPSVIGQYLAFSSFSRFIQVFRKETGVTPAAFRKKISRGNGHQKMQKKANSQKIDEKA